MRRKYCSVIDWNALVESRTTIKKTAINPILSITWNLISIHVVSQWDECWIIAVYYKLLSHSFLFISKMRTLDCNLFFPFRWVRNILIDRHQRSFQRSFLISALTGTELNTTASIVKVLLKLKSTHVIHNKFPSELIGNICEYVKVVVNFSIIIEISLMWNELFPQERSEIVWLILHLQCYLIRYCRSLISFILQRGFDTRLVYFIKSAYPIQKIFRDQYFASIQNWTHTTESRGIQCKLNN